MPRPSRPPYVAGSKRVANFHITRLLTEAGCAALTAPYYAPVDRQHHEDTRHNNQRGHEGQRLAVQPLRVDRRKWMLAT
jgi:hypothetical protein